MRLLNAIFATAVFSYSTGVATALRGRAMLSTGLERTIGAYHDSKESRNNDNIPDLKNLQFIADVVAPVRAMAMVNGKVAGSNSVVTNIEGYHGGGETHKSAPPQDDTMNLEFVRDVTARVQVTIVNEKAALRGSNSIGTTVEAYHSAGKAPKSASPKNDTKNLDFIRDVTAPVHVIAMANSKNLNGPHRSLQSGSPQCFVQDDGSMTCALEDFPADGLLTLLFDCIEGVSQCDRCTVVLAEDLDSLEAGLPTCDECITCGDSLSYDCANFFPTDPCAAMNCNGDCTNTQSTQPPTEPPTQPTQPPTQPTQTQPPSQEGGPQCFVQDDGSTACAWEDFPADGLLTLLFDCIEGVSVFQCDSCTVVLAEDLDSLEAGLPTCDGCITCGDSLSYDCVNFLPTEPCAAMNCNGDCTNTQSTQPPTEPPTQPTQPPTQPTQTQPPSQEGGPQCFVQDDGSTACAWEDFPADGLLTLLFDCIEGVSVFQCDSCTVVLAEDLDSLEAGLPTCDECITCGDSLSYDCANLSPDEPCATTNCNGDCINPGPDPTTQPPTQPTQTQPPTQPPTQPFTQPNTDPPTQPPTQPSSSSDDSGVRLLTVLVGTTALFFM